MPIAATLAQTESLDTMAPPDRERFAGSRLPVYDFHSYIIGAKTRRVEKMDLKSKIVSLHAISK